MKTLDQIKQELIAKHRVEGNDTHNEQVSKWALEEAKRVFDDQPKPELMFTPAVSKPLSNSKRK